MKIGPLGMAMCVLLGTACGSSYDPKYTIPADSELKKFEPADEEDILDEAGLEAGDEEVAPAAEPQPMPTPGPTAPSPEPTEQGALAPQSSADRSVARSW